LNYGFDKEDQPLYFEWIMDLFDVVRFFCALAVVGKAQYQAVIDELFAVRDPPLDDLARNWMDFVGARERMRSASPEMLTGIWSAFGERFRYHLLKPLILRWRWCTHIKRPGRTNEMRIVQVEPYLLPPYLSLPSPNLCPFLCRRTGAITSPTYAPCRPFLS